MVQEGYGTAMHATEDLTNVFFSDLGSHKICLESNIDRGVYGTDGGEIWRIFFHDIHAETYPVDTLPDPPPPHPAYLTQQQQPLPHKSQPQ